MPFLNAADLPWHEPPGHVRGYSRYLVNPDQGGSRYFDFRVSRYPTGGRVDLHVHMVAEQVYYIIGGRGQAVCGDERREIGPEDVMFVPAGAPHSLVSSGPEDLVFVVVTSPPYDIQR